MSAPRVDNSRTIFTLGLHCSNGVAVEATNRNYCLAPHLFSQSLPRRKFVLSVQTRTRTQTAIPPNYLLGDVPAARILYGLFNIKRRDSRRFIISNIPQLRQSRNFICAKRKFHCAERRNFTHALRAYNRAPTKQALARNCDLSSGFLFIALLASVLILLWVWATPTRNY